MGNDSASSVQFKISRRGERSPQEFLHDLPPYDPACAQAFHTAADESIAFARLYVLKFNKLVDVVVKLYTESVFDIGCSCHSCPFN